MLHVTLTPTFPVVVDEAFVREHPEAVLADVRWYLDGRDGRAAFEGGHLPGARWVDLGADLAAHGQDPTEGRHPFPAPEDFARAMSGLGIGDDTIVVAYDDSGGGTAGRLVVMLRMLGRSAALLDGGMRGWSGPLETGPAAAAGAAQFSAAPWPTGRFATADETGASARDGAAVLDARAVERFRGEVVVADPRPGHIPGARSAPWTTVLDTDGRLRSPEELRQHFERLTTGGTADGDGPVQGARSADVIAYCGSGVSACMNLVAMERAGLSPARLFVASWSGWSSDPDRPAETGG